MQAVVCEGKGTDMDGYTLSISRCSGGDGVEESFKAKIKRREAALDAFAVAEAYCKGIGMVSRCEREGFDGFIIELRSDAEDETIRLVRLVADTRSTPRPRRRSSPTSAATAAGFPSAPAARISAKAGM